MKSLTIALLIGLISKIFSSTPTIYVNDLQDSLATPSNCNTTSQSTGSCNLRSALTLCDAYLTSSDSLCRVVLPSKSFIQLNSSFGEIQFSTMIGTLQIEGNHSIISPLDHNHPMRFLVLSQTVANYLSLIVSNLQFQEFIALSSSGGVFNLQYLNQITFTNLLFQNNSAQAGGAIFIDFSSFITFTSCQFDLNNAQDGGAVEFNSNNNQILINKSTFSQNIAKGNSANSRNQGGGVYFNLQNTNIQISDCVFHENVAVNGGGVYLHSDNHVVLLSFNQFTSNSAESGGAFMIYNRNLDVTIQHTSFEFNNAIKYFGECFVCCLFVLIVVCLLLFLIVVFYQVEGCTLIRATSTPY